MSSDIMCFMQDGICVYEVHSAFMTIYRAISLNFFFFMGTQICNYVFIFIYNTANMARSKKKCILLVNMAYICDII